MKKRSVLQSYVLIGITLMTLIFNACSNSYKEEAEHVQSNIKNYTYVWDEIMNKGKLDMFNDSNFTKDVVMHASPSDIIGIDNARAYYANFLTGFSNIQFTIEDVFGQGDKLVKHWRFKGTHTGNFFGIPPTGKTVDIDGTTLVRMSNGKIAEEKDFYDNYEFLNQLGLIPQSK
jgi:steroid delta-isomerase-like uncharacterized protein